MLTRWFASREPRTPASAGKLRRGVATALVAAALLLGGALAPIAGASGHFHPYGECPGVQIGC